MSVKLVHAVGDYDGVYGDGDGREITYRRWYDRNGRGWQYLAICKDQNTANQACEIAKQIAENNRYGYSQQRRLTAAQSILKNGIPNGRGDMDCSSFMSLCYYMAGALPKYSYNTDTLMPAMKATGKFVILSNPKDDTQARIGAVYIAPRSANNGSGHTAMAINNGTHPYPIDPSPTPPAPLATPYLRILKGSVRVRENGGTEYPTLFVAHAGDTFPYLGTAGSGWYMVDISHVMKGIGYVSCNIPKYVEVVTE